MARIKKKKSLVIVIVSILILIIAVLAILIPKKLIKPKAGIGCNNNTIDSSECFCTDSSCYANEKVDGKWVTTKWGKEGTTFYGNAQEGYVGNDARNYQGTVDNPSQNAPDLRKEYGSGGNSQGNTGNTRSQQRAGLISLPPSPSPRPKFGEYVVREGYSFDNTPLRILIDLWLRYNGLK